MNFPCPAHGGRSCVHMCALVHFLWPDMPDKIHNQISAHVDVAAKAVDGRQEPAQKISHVKCRPLAWW